MTPVFDKDNAGAFKCFILFTIFGLRHVLVCSYCLDDAKMCFHLHAVEILNFSFCNARSNKIYMIPFKTSMFAFVAFSL